MRKNGKYARSKKYTYTPLASYWGHTFHELTLRLEKTPRREWLGYTYATEREAFRAATALRYHRDRARMVEQVEIRQHKLEDGRYVVGVRRSKTWKPMKEDVTNVRNRSTQDA